MKWTEISRKKYFWGMLYLTILPLIVGLYVTYIPVWSTFWWNTTMSISLLWIVWISVCTIFGWQNNRLARVLPLVLLLNISLFLAMVALWRSTKETVELGGLLLVSHIFITIFTLLYSKEWLLRDFSKVGWLGRFLIVIVFILPITWIIIIISKDLFTVKIVRPLCAAILGYFLVVPFTAGSIRFRDPNWNPKKKVSL